MAGQEIMKLSEQTASATLRLASDKIEPEKVDGQSKRLSRTKLINSLNHINFCDGEITLRFRHSKYNSFIFLSAKPQVCNDRNLTCLWADKSQNLTQLKYYTFESFSYSDGLRQVQVPANFQDCNKNTVYLELPDNSYESFRRCSKRYECNDVSAQISQDGWFVDGTLLNYSTHSFAVTFSKKSSPLKNNFDVNTHVNVVFNKDKAFIYSGSCNVLRSIKTNEEITLILKPLSDSVQRIKSKEFRSERLILSPLPTIKFRHPVIKKTFTLSLGDISGLGFSVEEDFENAVLLPGMVIDDMELQFMHGFSIRFKAQVLYRMPQNDMIKCGIVILDMTMKDHLKLSSLIHQAKNKNSFTSTSNLNIESLWNFFFESGFIYPEKYSHIAERKEQFVNTYQKLFCEHPEIVQHVSYLDKGKIYGHVSINRCNSRTWLLHHLAAIKSPKHKAGLVILEHVFKHINELHSLPSAKMDYLVGYFRPNNRFSNRLFGPKTVEAIGDLNKCSVDEFAYLFHEQTKIVEQPASSWNLSESNEEDLSILKHWYMDISGGLTVKALDLEPGTSRADEETNKEFKAAGFKRDRILYSLKHDHELIAVFIANISDFGLNMSDLTNCIQVLILDSKQLDKKTLQYALNNLSEYYENEKVPVLLFPRSYSDQNEIEYEKTYMLGILNLEYINDYLKFKESLTSPKKGQVIRQIN